MSIDIDIMLHTLEPAGEKGEGKSGKPLHFKGSVFHRIIPQFMLQVSSMDQVFGCSRMSSSLLFFWCFLF